MKKIIQLTVAFIWLSFVFSFTQVAFADRINDNAGYKIFDRYDMLCVLEFETLVADIAETPTATVTVIETIKGTLPTGGYKWKLPYNDDMLYRDAGKRYIGAVRKVASKQVKEYGEYVLINLIAYEENGSYYNNLGTNEFYGSLHTIKTHLSNGEVDITDKPTTIYPELTPDSAATAQPVESIETFNMDNIYVVKVSRKTGVYREPGKGRMRYAYANDILLVKGRPTIKQKYTVVYYGGEEYYIKTSDLAMSKSSTILTKKVSSSAQIGEITTSAYVYSSTSKSKRKIGAMRNNAYVAIVGETRSYYKIVTHSGTGYVLKSRVDSFD